jgi:hypothetical protein
MDTAEATSIEPKPERDRGGEGAQSREVLLDRLVGLGQTYLVRDVEGEERAAELLERAEHDPARRPLRPRRTGR